MAKAYVNYFADLDGGLDGAQAFKGRANQPSGVEFTVAANAAAALAGKIDLVGGTDYVEVKVTEGSVFLCILPTNATEADLTAARVRYDAGDRQSFSRGDLAAKAASLFIWAIA